VPALVVVAVPFVAVIANAFVLSVFVAVSGGALICAGGGVSPGPLIVDVTSLDAPSCTTP